LQLPLSFPFVFPCAVSSPRLQVFLQSANDESREVLLTDMRKTITTLLRKRRDLKLDFIAELIRQYDIRQPHLTRFSSYLRTQLPGTLSAAQGPASRRH
jgi:hypothetical protein